MNNAEVNGLSEFQEVLNAISSLVTASVHKVLNVQSLAVSALSHTIMEHRISLSNNSIKDNILDWTCAHITDRKMSQILKYLDLDYLYLSVLSQQVTDDKK